MIKIFNEMAIRWSLNVFIIVIFMVNISEIKSIQSKKPNGFKNVTFMSKYAPAMLTEFPLGIWDVFDDARDVFRKIVGKMVANKKLVGIDSRWSL